MPGGPPLISNCNAYGQTKLITLTNRMYLAIGTDLSCKNAKFQSQCSKLAVSASAANDASLN